MTEDAGLAAVTAINANLKKIYERHWPALSSCIPRGEHYSAPLLLQVDDRYCRAEVRVMVVGQQTNTWWGEDGWDNALRQVDPIRYQLDRYIEFRLGRDYRGPFWSAARSLVSQVGENRCGLIWSNLVRVDRARSKRDPHARPVGIEDRLRMIPLLQEEIATLSPHVVVFFTGPTYDGLLGGTFPEAKLEAGPLSRVKPVSRVIHAELPAKSFRTYHPNYLQRAGLHRSVLAEIVRLVGGIDPEAQPPK